MKRFLLISLISFFIVPGFSQDLQSPSFEEILSLKEIRNAVISPNGKHIAFEKVSTNWSENSFEREIWLSKDGGEPFQLTNNPGNGSRNPKWSPDGSWIAFISKRAEHNQIHVIRTAGGEALALTNIDTDIINFEWSPKGDEIAFLRQEDKPDELEKKKELYGEFSIDDEDYRLNQLWKVPFNESDLHRNPLPEQLKDSIYKSEMSPKLVLEDADFTINNFKWSPDGSRIAIEHQPDPLINSFFDADISIYEINSKTLRKIIANKSYDGLADWSPDGKSILYGTSENDTTSNYYLNGKLFRIDLVGSNNLELAVNFDEQINNPVWNSKGIFATAWEKTKRNLIHIDPETGNVKIIKLSPDRIRDYSFSRDAKIIAFTGENKNSLVELYIADYPVKTIKKITNSTQQIDNWAVSNSEVISWQSKDGQVIEGILHKPMDYDPGNKYPLFVVIHGGPTGISVPNPTPSYVYPVVQWLNKGALVLQPNYRGSAGYGEEFRSLNVRNLGVGDAWDVLSGVEYLEDKGMIDANKVGCMGWSQGGYISAFLTTNSDKFQAVSVGAGISNWMTYYVNTDIHPFTRQYLKATPWSDKEIYEKTSPMTNINNAGTPTLIQHGEFDSRVPIANAYELLQGLKDVGVEAKLIVYKGFGHGITKPKERLAATWHNWQWFNHYIWDEEIELPLD